MSCVSLEEEDMPELTQGLPPGWIRTTVASVGAVRLGRQRSPGKHTGLHATKYLRAANITQNGLDLDEVHEMDFTPDERRIYALRAGDVVLAEASGSSSHVGRAAVWRGEVANCCFQNTVIRFRPSAVSPEFANLVFRFFSRSGQFARVARGVGILHLGAARFSQMSFPLPPLAEQNRVVAEYDVRQGGLTDAAKSLQSALSRTEEQVREIIRVAMTGGFSDIRDDDSGPDAVVASQSLHVQRDLQGDVPTAPQSTPAIPQTPPSWAWCRVDEAGEVTLGRQRAPQHHQGPNMRSYLRVANVFEDRIDTSDVAEMNFSPEEYRVYALKYGDILLNEGQSPDLVGRPAMFRDEIPGVCFQKTLLRFRAKRHVDPEFALLVFRHYLHEGRFREVARWSTNIAHLTRQRFVAMSFPLPPLEEQQRIAREARARLDASAKQEAAIRASIARLPDLELELLTDAVNGRLATQNSEDEPAESLLEASELKLAENAVQEANVEGESEQLSIDFPVAVPPPAGQSGSILANVLKKAGRPLTLPELYSMAGYDRDSTEDIESFYLSVRAELQQSLKLVRSADGQSGPEDSLIELVEDAAE